MQYITNIKEFMKMDFYVDENVLVPRSDTEILVEEVMYIAKEYGKRDILELCTGSGAIAISLSKYLGDVKITATDISDKAINIAIKNEEILLQYKKINFIQSDIFEKVGKKYDIIVVSNIDSVEISGDYIYTKSISELNKWYKEEIIRIFDERYIYNFNRFKENVKSPILKIRTMKTRWGVYNRANHTITLNSKLIEYDYEKIDYVIIHELSHILHFNHSTSFWNLVSKYCPNYKEIRKEMKE